MRLTIGNCLAGSTGVLALVGLATPAQAGTNSGQLALGAQVNRSCSVSTMDLNFGLLDTHNVTEIDAEGTISVACISTTIFSIELDFGNHALGETRRIRNADGDYLTYEVYRNASRTQRWASLPVQSRNGVIIGMTNRSLPGLNNTLCLSPALTVSAEQIDRISDTIDAALTTVLG